MKPKTKFHKRILDLYEKTEHKIGLDVTAWAYDKVLLHAAFRTKWQTACLDCGHIWKTGNTALLINKLITDCECPRCGSKLKIEDTKRRKAMQRKFFTIIDLIDGLQRISHFEMISHHKVGAPFHVTVLYECAQIYIEETGDRLRRHGVVSRLRGGMGWYQDNIHSEMAIREEWYASSGSKFNLMPDAIYPKAKFLPIYKRNGFNGKYYGATPYDMLHGLANDRFAETLIKTKQYKLLTARLASNKEHEIERFWDSIKICIRNNYYPKDAGIWFDYLFLLDENGKDLRNAHYVCPPHLHKVHNELLTKKQAEEARIRAEEDARDQQRKSERAKREKEAIKKYGEWYGAYFNLQFTTEDLVIVPLKSVKEFKIEGEKLRHCVHANKYWAKPDSFCMSARIDGEPVETIEITLSRGKIEQARGMQNAVSKYHDAIVASVNANMGQITKIYHQLLKAARKAEQANKHQEHEDVAA